MHYLQVRDDYSIYSLASEQLKDVTDSRSHKANKKRNSVEGKRDFINFHLLKVNRIQIDFFISRWKWSTEYIESGAWIEIPGQIG